MTMDIEVFKKKTAVVILAFADYESLELALASHAKFSVDHGVHLFILQNGRGTYDCERTYQVAQRYHFLYPDQIDVIDDIKPDVPYRSLNLLFNSERFKEYDYIIKLDDDVMVLTEDWIDKLCKLYIEKTNQLGEEPAYVTSLVNNNPYGFKQIVDRFPGLSEEYFRDIARKHFVGGGKDDNYAPYRIIEKDTIYSGSNGTIWRYPYIARWLHGKTSLCPEYYIEQASHLGIAEVPFKERYSINCMLFQKTLWKDMCDGGTDDEHMLHAYCLKNRKRIFADLSIPMIHIAFFSQRDECRDLMDEFRTVYSCFFELNFPISMCSNRLIEMENRLRFMEKQYAAIGKREKYGKERVRNKLLRKIIGGLFCIDDNGLLFTIKLFGKKLWRKLTK